MLRGCPLYDAALAYRSFQMNTILAVAGGGALGALARHGVNALSLRVLGAGFAWHPMAATLFVNVLGSFLMGAAIAFFAPVSHASAPLRLFLMTGFLGAFTTFSAFSADAVSLWERGAPLQAGAYCLMSVVLSVLALIAGMAAIRGVAA
jgi:CrcB protein